MSSSDEFNDPFSENTGGGLLKIEGGNNIQGAKVAKGRGEEALNFKHEIRKEEMNRERRELVSRGLGGLKVVAQRSKRSRSVLLISSIGRASRRPSFLVNT
ncbi:MAG: hypothetical protein ACK49I_12445 [Verrucomicrobiota bacterium]